MPLKKGKSKKNRAENIKELQSSKPSEKREKAIRTYMKNHNVDYGEAKMKISLAIAYNQ